MMLWILTALACTGKAPPDDPGETAIPSDSARPDTAPPVDTQPPADTAPPIDTAPTETAPPEDTDTGAPAFGARLEAGEPITCLDEAARASLGPYWLADGGADWQAQLVDYDAGNRPPGRGLIVEDFDGDDWLDILLLNMGADQLYMGRPDQTWVDETAARWGDAVDYSMAGAAADVDADGDLDVVVANRGQANRLYLNDGTGNFTPHDAGFLDGAWGSVGAALADMDADGDLDLFFSGHWSTVNWDYAAELPGEPSELYENLGAGAFADASARLPRAATEAYTFVAAWTDLNGDGAQDLYLANDHGPVSTPNVALHNHDGTFLDVSADTHLDRSTLAMGLGIGDINDDLTPDFLMSGWGELSLMESAPDGTWYDSALSRNLMPDESVSQHVSWGTELADLDNDGRLDAVINFGQWDSSDANDEDKPDPALQPDEVFWQHNDGHFEPVGLTWGVADATRSRGVVLADLNRDGFLDLVKAPLDSPATIHLSRCGAASWLSVSLHQPGTNPDAVGATLIAEHGSRRYVRWVHAGGTSLSSSGPLAAHFGFGDLDVVDLTVIWPDGDQHTFEDVSLRRRVLVVRE